MKTHLAFAGTAFLFGLAGFVVFGAVSAVTGRLDVALMAYCISNLTYSALFIHKHPESKWYGGAMVNLLLFAVLVYVIIEGMADFWPWAVCLVITWLGSFLGLPFVRKKEGRTISAGLIISLVFLVLSTGLVIYFYNTTGAEPIPKGKESFIGTWKTDSGLVLTIRADGRAVLDPRTKKGSQDYERLCLHQGFLQIDSFNVAFYGDTMLQLARPAYYARQYHIDRNPYTDSTKTIMILNGRKLIKNP